MTVTSCPGGLDVTASRTGKRVYLHVVNTERTRSPVVTLDVRGARIVTGQIFTLAADPELEIFEHVPGVLEPVKQALPSSGRWTFPAASVSAVELDIEEAEEAPR